MCWFTNNDQGGVQSIFSSNNNPGGYKGFWVQYKWGNILEVSYGTGNCYTPSCRQGWEVEIPETMRKNAWMHIAVSYNSPEDANIYLNGILMQKRKFGVGVYVLYNGNNPVARIGTYQHGHDTHNYFYSKIDDLSVWNKSLSVEDVRKFICSRVDSQLDSLLAYFRFDKEVDLGIVESETSTHNGFAIGNFDSPLSGAYIGDISVNQYPYNPSNPIAIADNLGAFLTVVSENFSGVKPKGYHLYRVDGEPTITTGIGDDGAATGSYFGVFAASDVQRTFPSGTFRMQYALPDADKSPIHVYLRHANDTSWFPAANVSDLGNGVYEWVMNRSMEIYIKTNTTTEQPEPDIPLPFELRIPNTFTPNGDGNNDEYFISEGNPQVFDLLIYNRWGQLVYRSNDINKSWDGTFGLRDVAEGVYPAVLRYTDFSGKEVIKKYHIHLFR